VAKFFGFAGGWPDAHSRKKDGIEWRDWVDKKTAASRA